MENGMVLFESNKAVVETKRGNYEIVSPFDSQKKAELKRNTDFGLIPGKKKPSMFKPGAEKICMLYGLIQHYTIESKKEEFGDNPLFFYAVKCELVKINPADGAEYVFACGLGSANTNERRNGTAGAYDTANTALKMAKIRALRDAAISIGGLSDIFDQDMENEDFMKNAKDIYEQSDPNAKLSSKQVQRIFAIAGNAGLNPNMAKNKIIAMGFPSTKDITQKDYERVCEELAKG